MTDIKHAPAVKVGGRRLSTTSRQGHKPHSPPRSQNNNGNAGGDVSTDNSSNAKEDYPRPNEKQTHTHHSHTRDYEVKGSSK
ncbi:hypothetical protein Moror_6180 [Moniliophthora roreri MCA 2997]|uniref:Uncharacterized protein n=1 Tax=Moniliophthora roreri (strain MCA 2997) TaxID=1381753 RepID=V2WW81_MONRO|nr:hypothetical protein Moror_6180 [Moniliophthora roreri MCA 2997]